EKVGRTASGWAGFREVSALARNEGQTDRADDAQRRAEALEPRLIKLLLVIPSPAPAGLVITRNGEAVPEPLWGSSVPVDPGSYTIVAEATGRRRHEVVVDATEPGAQLRVEIPTLALSEASDATDPATLAAPKSDEGAASSNSWQAPLGIASFAVGGAVALGAGALAIAAKARANAADCDEDNLCSSQGVDDRASARTMGDVATVMLIAGGVVGAAGLVIWLTAPSEDDAETERSALSLELHPTALSLSLRF
ncbi:MAG: hypothetical protein KC731_08480, partial [Myxococcales bacterium]|nr:hypothetical protein [Myxococcales bacterium]